MVIITLPPPYTSLTLAVYGILMNRCIFKSLNIVTLYIYTPIYKNGSVTIDVKVERAKQPSIAIICSQFHEKTAVDCLLRNQQTFVRYATVG